MVTKRERELIAVESLPSVHELQAPQKKQEFEPKELPRTELGITILGGAIAFKVKMSDCYSDLFFRPQTSPWNVHFLQKLLKLLNY